MTKLPCLPALKTMSFAIFYTGALILVSIINSYCQPTFDLVITGGRVIDPETNVDDVYNVGITNGRIVEISKGDLQGSEVLDIKGLVLAPGFIDLHAHGITNKEQEFQAHDGVTTALELEGGIELLKEWHDLRREKAMINYGGSASWRMAHALSKTQNDGQLLKARNSRWDRRQISSEINPRQPSELKSEKEIDIMLKHIGAALEEGAIGIGLPVAYNPMCSREEIFRVFQFASSFKAPIFIHVRDFGLINIQQAIADAAITGAPLHIVHVNSVALSEIGLAIEMVSEAQKKGFDITTELYPYTAASTSIQSTLFEDGWQKRWGGISYNDLQWTETGERLTEATFSKYRKQGGNVVAHMMKPEWIALGMRSPITMIASDGMPYAKFAHPRTAGTFSRVLGKYVREEKILSLPDAIRKMTLMPANRLQEIAPMMRLKGRIQVGCDADITIFDPSVIIDRATFERGLEFSHGIQHVLVNGVLVVRNGQTVANVFPGKPVCGKYKR